jgi:hypothetical protein
MDHFSLLPSSQAEPVQLAYTEVQQVGTGGMPVGKQWAIFVGVFAGVVGLLVVLALHMSD